MSTATAALGTRTPIFYLAHHILQEGLHQQEVIMMLIMMEKLATKKHIAPTGGHSGGLPGPGLGHWGLCLWLYCRPGEFQFVSFIQ